ncbi:hypothetical protein FRC15_002038 [Serendipita sp. 397]|nr:hypothetical protein FRC15_002038 [Serendipita sp. 397]
MLITRTSTRSQRTDAIPAHSNDNSPPSATAATTKERETTSDSISNRSFATNPRISHDLANQMTTRTAATRTPHRVTVRKTAQQVHRLQEMWASTTTPTKEQREQIADEIGLDVRIVSTWFRDERSKLTRQRAEQQRAEQRASANHAATTTTSGSNTAGQLSTTTGSSATATTAIAPTTRSTRVSAAAASRRNQSVDAQSDYDEEEEDEEEEALDRYQPPPTATPSSRQAHTGSWSQVPYPGVVVPRSVERASPEMKSKRSVSVSSTRGAPHQPSPRLAKESMSPRFSPYPTPSSTLPLRARRTHHHAYSSSFERPSQYVTPAQYSQPQSSPYRSSAPIDIYHRHRTPVMQSTPGGYRRHHHHRSRLSVETDSDYGLPSPGYPRQSVPAPSEASSSTSEEELEEEDEDEEMMIGDHGYVHPAAQHDDRRRRHHDDRQGDHEAYIHSRDYSPRTPSQMPHSLPSPRVMHAPSSSVPSAGGLPPISSLGVGLGGAGSFSPKPKPLPPLSLSPLRNSITLPHESSAGSYMLDPISLTPARDSLWRWNYHDRVSSIRHTLSDKLYHNSGDGNNDDDNRHRRDASRDNQRRRRGEDSEEEEVLSDGGLSPIASPFFRSSRIEGVGNGTNASGGFLERIGGFFTSGGAGKKQLFATEEERAMTMATNNA